MLFRFLRRLYLCKFAYVFCKLKLCIFPARHSCMSRTTFLFLAKYSYKSRKCGICSVIICPNDNPGVANRFLNLTELCFEYCHSIGVEVDDRFRVRGARVSRRTLLVIFHVSGCQHAPSCIILLRLLIARILCNLCAKLAASSHV